VTHHILNAFVHQSVGDGYGLLGVAHVVHFNGNEFFTHHTAGGIDAFDGHA